MGKQIAVVTGASSGLGAEFIRQLDNSEELDEMWVIARRRDRLNALGETVHTPLRILTLDLVREDSIRELKDLLKQEQPEIRVLINAAGMGKIGSWEEISLSNCEDMIDLNCRAAVSVTQTALNCMGEGSRILEICSTAAFQPFPYLNVYAASKAFLYSYSRALRVELKHTGIQVTAVCPYWIKDTEFISTAQKTQGSSQIHSFPLASKCSKVVASALRDSRRNFAVSTPGPICSMHRFFSKIIPDSLMMGFWDLIRK